MTDETEITEAKPFTFPTTNLEFQRLLMARRVLQARGEEPTKRLYNLITDLYDSRKSLGLDFPESFRARVASEKNLGDKQGGEGDKLKDEFVLKELRPKIAGVLKAVDDRIKYVEEVLKFNSEVDPETLIKKTDLEKNIELLSMALQFNDIQKKILLFYACAPKGRFEAILKAAHPDDVVSHENYIDSLAILLDLKDKREELENELKPDSTLVGVNFLAHGKENEYSVDKLLQRILLTNYKSTDELLSSLLGPSPTTELKAADYAYMANDLDTMAGTFEGFLRDKNPKIRKNMTIGGPPGTGKTQITSILAERLKVRAFLVGVAQKSETTGFSLEEPTREERIKALVRSAFIVRQTRMKAILVFDEAEDILRDLNREDTKETGSKAFINELLEGLGAPVIFISNRTDLFDPATTRRILPYYSMNYMPLSARVATIISKTEKYVGTTLTQSDVKQLSTLAGHMSVAIIDSCINIAAQRLPTKSDKKVVLKEIEAEFNRALKAQNGGIPPMPIERNFSREEFDPNLISASDDVTALQATFTKDAGRLAGKDFTIIGAAGTGRKSIAQFLAATTGMEPRVVPMNCEALAKFPEHAHALDMERAALDGAPLVFTDSMKFLMNSAGHPFMERVHAHPQPTFFVSGIPNNISQSELEDALSHMTFVVRTGDLSPKQMQTACKTFLEIDLSPAELAKVKAMSIGSIMTVKKQLEAMGKIGDKETALERMGAIAERLKKNAGGPIGFAQAQEEAAGFARRAASSRTSAPPPPMHT